MSRDRSNILNARIAARVGYCPPPSWMPSPGHPYGIQPTVPTSNGSRLDLPTSPETLARDLAALPADIRAHVLTYAANPNTTCEDFECGAKSLISQCVHPRDGGNDDAANTVFAPVNMPATQDAPAVVRGTRARVGQTMVVNEDGNTVWIDENGVEVSAPQTGSGDYMDLSYTEPTSPDWFTVDSPPSPTTYTAPQDSYTEPLPIATPVGYSSRNGSYTYLTSNGDAVDLNGNSYAAPPPNPYDAPPPNPYDTPPPNPYDTPPPNPYDTPPPNPYDAPPPNPYDAPPPDYSSPPNPSRLAAPADSSMSLTPTPEGTPPPNPDDPTAAPPPNPDGSMPPTARRAPLPPRSNRPMPPFKCSPVPLDHQTGMARPYRKDPWCYPCAARRLHVIACEKRLGLGARVVAAANAIR